MSKKSLFNDFKSSAVDTPESVYVSPTGGIGTRIDSFTAANNTGINGSYKAYIYASSGLPVSAVVPFKIVLRDRYDNAPSLINKVIPPGGSLRVESNVANGISFTASGEDL